MYLSLTAIQIGLGLAVGVLWISLLAPVSLATIHVTAVRREEPYLSAKFGREYDDYRSRVRRYL
jgi:protein-S-isoprenylcysteine O-methyltransferase Ste14